MSLEVFDGVVRRCLTSVWLCMKYELTAILGSGGGSIINISSVDALLAAPGTGSYAAAKAGVNALSRAAAAEYASQGVRVNVISRGAIETPMLAANLAAGSAEERDAIMERYLSMIDSRRLGRSEELAAAVVWLASDHASSWSMAESEATSRARSSVDSAPWASPNANQVDQGGV